MKRRGFLGTLVAAVVAPFLPTSAPSPSALEYQRAGEALDDLDRLSEQYRIGVREYQDMPDWYQQVTLRPGDIYTIEGVYVSDPQGESRGQLREFVVQQVM